MNKLKDILDNQRRLYKKLIKAVEDRRQNWDSFHGRSKNFFNTILNEVNEAPFFDSLYIDDGEAYLPERKNQNTITLYFGQHATGIHTIENKENGKSKTVLSIIEKGGALHYAQSSNGQVICIIYGCKSDLLKAKDEWFVFKRYNNPKEITDKEMMKAFKTFLWYNRITSYITGFTIFNTYRLNYYKLRSFSSRPDWNMIFGVIGALAALVSILVLLF